ncbi:hypothetical protein Tco_0859231 [Tanacetum coccineum]|uniref:Uncharacterized protein n=1 Tax=Tanacetum coccineum TaxID=301880 RepID=A0ABQ5BH50_9ASTR
MRGRGGGGGGEVEEGREVGVGGRRCRECRGEEDRGRGEVGARVGGAGIGRLVEEEAGGVVRDEVDGGGEGGVGSGWALDVVPTCRQGARRVGGWVHFVHIVYGVGR